MAHTEIVRFGLGLISFSRGRQQCTFTVKKRLWTAVSIAVVVVVTFANDSVAGGKVCYPQLPFCLGMYRIVNFTMWPEPELDGTKVASQSQ